MRHTTDIRAIGVRIFSMPPLAQVRLRVPMKQTANFYMVYFIFVQPIYAA
jgi:hypothetical protein